MTTRLDSANQALVLNCETRILGRELAIDRDWTANAYDVDFELYH